MQPAAAITTDEPGVENSIEKDDQTQEEVNDVQPKQDEQPSETTSELPAEGETPAIPEDTSDTAADTGSIEQNEPASDEAQPEAPSEETETKSETDLVPEEIPAETPAAETETETVLPAEEESDAEFPVEEKPFGSDTEADPIWRWNGEQDPSTIEYTITDEFEPGTVIDERVDENGNIIQNIASAPIEIEKKAKKSFNPLDSFELFADLTEAPSVEKDNWDDYPVSYEYNWDNSQSAWNWGEWRDGVKYTTPEGTYDNNVRHAMGMYSDGENIHLHISYATIYQSIANGDDFNFYINGVGAKMRIIYADNGSGITGQGRAPGTYDLVVVNGDHWNSGYEANGSYGTMVVKEGNINNELEIVVPLETLKQQNSAIDTNHVSNIEFFSPNLMYRHISCGGASSGPGGFVGISFITFMCALFVYTRQGVLGFAFA